ncbi:hypothetical protein CC1G_11174 [Coprinopsis cinerea okayama7|uniref:Extracellular membrane protein CFEM domain-containing protein n=1 Tax=Coprinopsis cinerea (strain Okayama-7 / 130 / ATCC MYA-4618 / FGSC 9003) TaxID=240176 RepID=A8P4D8_COPC7|nr:hypothetical protein CC1G_11174 [Coprinopsis cinerea okayama7\|eukprot:XP_001838731.1 hypothetical protein CC1G_11174 [Coprinopsis cinerea okayama7\
MVNVIGFVALYATFLCSLILPVLAQQYTDQPATPDHVAVINAEDMPAKCNEECTLASEKLVNCNRNGTCYCDDITTVPIQDCFRCAVDEGYSRSKVNGVFDDIAENCRKYKTPVNNLSLSGAAKLSLGFASVSVVAGLMLLNVA